MRKINRIFVLSNTDKEKGSLRTVMCTTVRNVNGESNQFHRSACY